MRRIFLLLAMIGFVHIVAAQNHTSLRQKQHVRGAMPNKAPFVNNLHNAIEGVSTTQNDNDIPVGATSLPTQKSLKGRHKNILKNYAEKAVKTNSKQLITDWSKQTNDNRRKIDDMNKRNKSLVSNYKCGKMLDTVWQKTWKGYWAENMRIITQYMDNGIVKSRTTQWYDIEQSTPVWIDIKRETATYNEAANKVSVLTSTRNQVGEWTKDDSTVIQMDSQNRMILAQDFDLYDTGWSLLMQITSEYYANTERPTLLLLEFGDGMGGTIPLFRITQAWNANEQLTQMASYQTATDGTLIKDMQIDFDVKGWAADEYEFQPQNGLPVSSFVLEGFDADNKTFETGTKELFSYNDVDVYQYDHSVKYGDLVTSYTFLAWNADAQQWSYAYREYDFTYDKYGYPLQYYADTDVNMLDADAQWTKAERHEYKYTPMFDCNETYQMSDYYYHAGYVWDGNNWRTAQIENATPDFSYALEYYNLMWDSEQSRFTSSDGIGRFAFSYHGDPSDEMLDSAVFQTWDTDNQTWVTNNYDIANAFEFDFVKQSWTYNNKKQETNFTGYDYETELFASFAYDIVYDDSGNETEYTEKEFDGTELQNTYREVYVYKNGNLQTAKYQIWDGSDWFTFDQEEMRYNITNDIIEYLYLTFGDVQLDSVYRELYIYNNNDYSIVMQEYDGKWHNTDRVTIGNNWKLYEKWAKGAWQNDYYLYDEDRDSPYYPFYQNNPAGRYTYGAKEWNADVQRWFIVYYQEIQWAITCNAYNRPYRRYAEGSDDGLAMINEKLELRKYSCIPGELSLSEFVVQQWDLTTSQWVNQSKQETQYTDDGNCGYFQKDFSYQWDKTNQKWLIESGHENSETLDANNNVTEWWWRDWTEVGVATGERELTTFNNDGDVITLTRQTWSNDSYGWANVSQEINSWSGVSELHFTDGNITHIDCYGAATGKLDISVAGGTQPYTFEWSNGATAEDAEYVTAGVYSVTVTDANGCKISSPKGEVTQNTEIKLTMSSKAASTPANQPNPGIDGAAWVDVKGGIAPYTFKWDNPLRETTDSIAELKAGTYRVTVTDALGCVKAQSVEVKGDNSGVGVKDGLTLNGISLYPNPSNGRFYVYMSEPNTSVSVTDINGRQVYGNDVSKNGTMYVDISTFGAGIYIVKTISGTNVQTLRVVVQ